jgi:hypothetical protein
LRLALNVGRVVVGPEYSAEPVAHEVKEPSGRVVKSEWPKVDMIRSATGPATTMSRAVPGTGHGGHDQNATLAEEVGQGAQHGASKGKER